MRGKIIGSKVKRERFPRSRKVFTHAENGLQKWTRGNLLTISVLHGACSHARGGRGSEGRVAGILNASDILLLDRSAAHGVIMKGGHGINTALLGGRTFIWNEDIILAIE